MFGAGQTHRLQLMSECESIIPTKLASLHVVDACMMSLACSCLHQGRLRCENPAVQVLPSPAGLVEISAWCLLPRQLLSMAAHYLILSMHIALECCGI